MQLSGGYYLRLTREAWGWKTPRSDDDQLSVTGGYVSDIVRMQRSTTNWPSYGDYINSRRYQDIVIPQVTNFPAACDEREKQNNLNTNNADPPMNAKNHPQLLATNGEQMVYPCITNADSQTNTKNHPKWTQLRRQHSWPKVSREVITQATREMTRERMRRMIAVISFQQQTMSFP